MGARNPPNLPKNWATPVPSVLTVVGNSSIGKSIKAALQQVIKNLPSKEIPVITLPRSLPFFVTSGMNTMTVRVRPLRRKKIVEMLFPPSLQIDKIKST